MPNDDFEVPPGQMGTTNGSKMAQNRPKMGYVKSDFRFYVQIWVCCISADLAWWAKYIITILRHPKTFWDTIWSKMAQKWPKIAQKWAISKVPLDFTYRYGYVVYLLTWHDDLNTKLPIWDIPRPFGTPYGQKMAQKWPKIARKWAMSKVPLNFMHRYG